MFRIRNYSFLIRIHCEVEIGKKLSILVNVKTQMGWNLELFKFFKYCGYNHDEFAHFQFIINIFIVLCEKGQDRIQILETK